MEYSKKFALVPLDRMQEFEEDHLSELDSQIQNILKKKVRDDEKVKLYNQLLQKYVTFPNVNAVKLVVPEPKIDQENEKLEVVEPDLEVADPKVDILSTVPVKFKKIAKNITSFLQQNYITWNEKQEVFIDNKVVPGSNIIQMINFLLRKRKRRPKAFDKFQEELRRLKFPEEFVKNTYLSNIKTYPKRFVGKKQESVKTMYAKPKRVVKKKPNNWIEM